MFKTSQSAVRRDLLLAASCLLILCAVQVWGQSQNLVRSRSTMRMENGVQRLLFAFPAGRLVVNLPDDIRPGEMISGTVVSEPAGADDVEKAKNRNVLEGYVIDLGDGTRVNADKEGFMWRPQLAAPNMPDRYLVPIMIFDPAVKDPAAGLNIVLSKTVTPAPASFTLPTIGQTGRNLSITGPFDGDLGNTKCAIGAAECLILAESPRKIVVSAPLTVAGHTTISVGDGKASASGNLRNIGIGLSAPKTNLMKGEKTTLTIQVYGLAGLKEPVSVQLITTGVVTVDGGNSQIINITPGQIQSDGSFSLTKELTGTSAGAFNVTATLLGSP